MAAIKEDVGEAHSLDCVRTLKKAVRSSGDVRVEVVGNDWDRDIKIVERGPSGPQSVKGMANQTLTTSQRK